MLRCVIAVSLCAIAAHAVAQPSPQPAKPAPAAKRALPDPLLTEAQAAVAGKMKDPSSTQFQNVRKLQAVDKRGRSMTVVCGSVNAKNSFGGYSGFVPWIYYGDMREAFVLGPDRDIAAAAMITDYCTP